MKTIGLLGGMSWESTISYYQLLNRIVKEKIGGLHSAKCLLYSVDFQEIEECQSKGEWQKSGEILAAAAQSLEKGGADFIILCTNTMHKVADQIQEAVSIPLLHIADVTTAALKRQGLTQVALLGTAYTMEQDFYKGRLAQNGIRVLIPEEPDRAMINNVIFNELCLGAFYPGSKAAFLRVMGKLQKKGAQGVILGCTEIGLLVNQQDTDIPLFDTTILHSRAAALLALDLEDQ
ncbi:MAG: aspartate/glutamate racemase family protein [Peptococcaceae bacterium]|nr:aspartate/glutamate racemase family protein [Peptococcaceae bacterium]